MPSDDTVIPNDQTTDVVDAHVGAQVVDTVALFVQLAAVSFLLAAVVRPTSEAGVEGLWNGQTLGKRWLGIKVVDRRQRLFDQVADTYVVETPSTGGSAYTSSGHGTRPGLRLPR